MPARFQQADGVIVQASPDYHYQSRTGHQSLYAINFSLQGNGNQFSYPAYLSNAEQVLGEMQPGTRARVLYTGWDPNNPTLWGLTLDGQSVIEPEDVSGQRRSEGGKLLLYSILMGVGLVWLLRRAKQTNGPEKTGSE